MNWISFSMKARVNDLEFLNTLLELLNNQFKNKRAFLPLGLKVFLVQPNLVTNSYPTARQCRNPTRELGFPVAIALPVSWAEICFWATPSSDLMMLEQQQSSCTQRGVSPVQTTNIPLFKINTWSPDSGGRFSEMELHGFKTGGQREVMLLSKRSCSHWLVRHWLQELELISALLTLCSVGPGKHKTSIRGYLKSTAFFWLNWAWLTWSLKILVSVRSDSPDCSSSQAHFTNCRGSS